MTCPEMTDPPQGLSGVLPPCHIFGVCVGALGDGPLADTMGRKWTLFVIALTSIIGGTLAAGSMHVAMLIVVRILQGSGFGALTTLVPIYLAETSTPSKRGVLTGLHGFWMLKQE